MSNKTENKPYVGMPATLCVVTDRYPGVIVEVSKSGKRVLFKGENNREAEVFSQRKDGHFRPQGCRKNCGIRLSLGRAEFYLDPHF